MQQENDGYPCREVLLKLAGFLETLPAWTPEMGTNKDNFLKMAEGLYNRIREVLKDQIKEVPPIEPPVEQPESL